MRHYEGILFLPESVDELYDVQLLSIIVRIMTFSL